MIHKSKIICLMVLLLSSCDIGNGFRIEGKQVVYERVWNAGHGTQIIKVNADADTFEILGKNNMVWGRDKDNVFNEHHMLEFLDRDTFKVLNEFYGKDKAIVVCNTKPILNADVDTFQIKEFIDETGRKIVLGVDKNGAYNCGDHGLRTLPVDSVEDLHLIQGKYHKDKSHVYWGAQMLPNANPDTFRLLEQFYSTDGTYVYHYYDLVEGADPVSFKVIKSYTAFDKYNKYHGSKKLD